MDIKAKDSRGPDKKDRRRQAGDTKKDKRRQHGVYMHLCECSVSAANKKRQKFFFLFCRRIKKHFNANMMKRLAATKLQKVLCNNTNNTRTPKP